MNRIVDIAKRSDQYLKQFEANVIRVIEANEDQIVDFNRSQLINHKTAEDKPLIHRKTKSALLSKAYARRKGKTKPDLFDSGVFQDRMFLTVPSKDEYFISSKDFKTGFLSANYGEIFGVSPSNQSKATKLNDSAIINDYLQTVMK